MATIPKQQLYRDLEPLLKSPKPPDHQGRIWSFCPSHPDGQTKGRRSLSLHPEIGLDCFGGCEFTDILKSLGYDPSERRKADVNEPDATYKFYGTDGSLVAEHGRWNNVNGAKTFAWRKPSGEWKDGIRPMKEHELPLYNSHFVERAKADSIVYFVEGEKAADACIKNLMLAVTGPGGASQRQWGDSLAILRGRAVALWPDNDAVGREYMVRIQAALKGVASTTYFVTPPRPLPEKGDAADYFALGGTKEELAAQVVMRPTIEYLDTDAVRVAHPMSGQPFEFIFTRMEMEGRSLEAELQLNPVGADKDDAWVQRINILSSSQRTELRRELDNLHGKELQWGRVLNTVFTMVRHSYEERDQAVDAADIPDSDGDRFSVDPLLPEGHATILFGDGGTSKSYFSFALALAYATGQPFLGMSTPGLPVMVVDYEDTEANFKNRLKRIARGLGMEDVPKGKVFYWAGRDVPLRVQADAIRRKVIKENIGLVIVDSVVPAVADDPTKAHVVGIYFNALRKIGVTTLSIAHITKGFLDKNGKEREGDTRKPFASVFWHNQARRTWYVHREDDRHLPTFNVALYCRKVNDGRSPEPITLSVEFKGSSSVTFDSASITASPELDARRSSKDRIWSALHGVARTAEWLSDNLDMPIKTVQNTLTNNPKSFVRVGKTSGATKAHDMWGRIVYGEVAATEEYAPLMIEDSPDLEF